MMAIAEYACEMCNKKYDTMDKAMDCERSHPDVATCKVKQRAYGGIPYKLEIVLSNGEIHPFVHEMFP